MKPRDYLNKLDEVAQTRVTPEEITTLPEDGVFVFGSKPDGNHEKGAAGIATEKFGATAGKEEGFSGQSYAIPVHRHRTEIMSDAIGRFISFARSHPGLKFYVLPVGCGNARMNVNMVADMFKDAIEVDNIFLPSIFIKSLRKTYRINANDPLPIKYVEEDIHSAVLDGRAMGLMMEISKRTDDPITFEDRILKEDNLLLHAFLRIVKVTTPEEQRVLDALLEEAKKVSGDKKDTNSTLASLMFVKGWKFDAMAKFEEGGSMYDLLEFSDKEYFAKIRMVEDTPGYRGKLKDANLTIKIIDDKKCLCDRSGNLVNVPDYDDIVSSGWSGRGWKVKSGGKWGMLNERLEIMIPAEYEDIDVVYEGGFMVRKGGKWGYLPADGPIAPNCIYEEVNKYISSGWKGFRAKKDGKWGVAGFDGSVMVAFDYDEVSLGTNGMAKVKSDGLFGFVNVNNGNVIPAEYDHAHDFSSVNADMAVVGKHGLRGVIDINASVIIPLIYDSVYIDGNDRFRVKKDGHYGIIDKNLNTIFPFVYRDLGKFDKDGVTYAMNDHGKYGYVNENNAEIIGFQFVNAKSFDSEGYAEVSNGYHQNGLIDKCGAAIIPMRYIGIHKYCDGIVELAVEDERHRYVYGIHDLKTGESIPCKYSGIEPLGRNKDGIMEYHCWLSRGGEPIKRYATKNRDNPGIVEQTTMHLKYSVRDSHVVIEDITAGRVTPGLYCECIALNGILTLPKEIDGVRVTDIADFCQCHELKVKGLIVPEGYRYIGIDVFKANPYLEFVSLPNGIRKIQDCAFSGCPDLKHVFIGKPSNIFALRNPFSTMVVSRCAFVENNTAITFYVPDEIHLENLNIDRSRFCNIKPRRVFEDQIIEAYCFLR